MFHQNLLESEALYCSYGLEDGRLHLFSISISKPPDFLLNRLKTFLIISYLGLAGSFQGNQPGTV
jgi:hypothetical protein